MWDYEFWLNIMMNCENRKAYGDAMYMIIWTMIDLGGELISWVSQVILRKSIPAGTQNYKKKLAKDVEDTFKILVIFMLSADSVWINLAKSFCICKIDASMQRVSSSSTQQIQAPKPTRYPNDHSRNCLPLWHLSSRDASKIQKLPNLSKYWQTLALWKYLCGSKVAPKKIRPPRSSGN